jgi:EAL domain-containing protein (putative c-di-GMP-specific phosphodiesterase class I)
MRAENRPSEADWRNEGGVPSMVPGPAGECPWALPGAGLAMLYQPVVSMCTGTAVSVEALARLDHPRRGILAPEHFVLQMEGAGLARELTERVAALAFRDFARHLARLGTGMRLAINLPLDVLLNHAALTTVDAYREAAGIAPERLVLELTESQPLDMANPAQMAAFAGAIRRLRALGFAMALDDAGPETPDLPALLGCGFTVLKLDRGVVDASGTVASAGRFLRETIAAAKSAGMSIVAEGVADEAGWRRMGAFGVDAVQGYFVAPPLPAAALAGWLETWRAPGA